MLSRLEFRFAKTMPDIPHWYVTRTADNAGDYAALFDTIQKEGVWEKFGKRRYRYWRPGDGFKYWAMTTDVRYSRVINRAKVAESDDANPPRASRRQARRLPDQSNDARLATMTDDDIAKAVVGDPDAPPLDIDWSKARLVAPLSKDIVTLRLDSDLLEWFRAQGKGYQTRINQVLRTFFEAKRAQGGP
jgi:uncharacterized protein (DUF4415 family)